MGHFSIGLTASMLGVCVKTLRRWEESGYLVPAFRTSGGHRRYAYTQLQSFFEGDTDTSQLTVLYARVGSYDQKSDLGRQADLVRAAAVEKGYANTHLIQDIGSGLNFEKRGFLSLLKLMFQRKVQRIVVVHKDRLLRFGFPLIEKLCFHLGVSIEVLDHRVQSPSESLVKDVIELMTVMSARMHGRRAHAHRQLRQDYA